MRVEGRGEGGGEGWVVVWRVVGVLFCGWNIRFLGILIWGRSC